MVVLPYSSIGGSIERDRNRKSFSNYFVGIIPLFIEREEDSRKEIKRGMVTSHNASHSSTSSLCQCSY